MTDKGRAEAPGKGETPFATGAEPQPKDGEAPYDLFAGSLTR
jgi:hypothetical protein